MEERISGIESVLGDIANTMGKKLDEHTRSLAIQGQQLTELSKKIDEQEITLYEQGVLLKGHSRSLVAMGRRLDKIEGKVDALSAEIHDKFEQVIALLTQKADEPGKE